MKIVGPLIFYLITFFAYQYFATKMYRNEDAARGGKKAKSSLIAIVIVYTIIEFISFFG
jgi:hypothetical protein